MNEIFQAKKILKQHQRPPEIKILFRTFTLFYLSFFSYSLPNAILLFIPLELQPLLVCFVVDNFLSQSTFGEFLTIYGEEKILYIYVYYSLLPKTAAESKYASKNKRLRVGGVVHSRAIEQKYRCLSLLSALYVPRIISENSIGLVSMCIHQRPLKFYPKLSDQKV